MRISDWSSDVCSSDLGIVDVLIAGHRVLAEQRDGRHDLARLAVAALHHVELFPGGLHRPSRLAVDRLDGGDRAAGDVADRGDARARGDAVHMHGASTAHRHATAEFGAGQRSEEHTSELQSLMRISYAVFCLKKKKKTPN